MVVNMFKGKAPRKSETFLQYVCRAMNIEPGDTVRISDEMLELLGGLYAPPTKERRLIHA